MTEVMREVKSLMFPTTLEEKVCTPVVIDLVKSPPDTRGVAPPSEAGAAEAVAARPKVGS